MSRVVLGLWLLLSSVGTTPTADLDPLFEQMQRDYLFGQYQAESDREQRAAFDRVLETSEQVLAREPDSARTQLWAAVSWGLYGMSHSKLSSATHGVADKIRLHATHLIEIDPTYEHGAGYRLLGRLHTTVPRVPWVSMWVDKSTGVELLRKALDVSREDPRNLLFLAEALLDSGDSATEAAALLREATAREPRPDHLQEDAETLEQARTLLEDLEESQ